MVAATASGFKYRDLAAECSLAAAQNTNAASQQQRDGAPTSTDLTGGLEGIRTPGLGLDRAAC